MKVTNILLVDDKRENLLALESLLRADSIAFHRATSGVRALELLLSYEFALALIDVHMPEMDGFELAELMRGTEHTRSVPIIFVTAGAHDRLSLFKGYERGAVDFLYKPLDPHIVKSKVQVFLDLARQRQLLTLQLHETQRALEERDEALRTAKEALNTRDEFMSIASHELKTPLTSLHLQIQLMGRTLQKAHRSPASTVEGALSVPQTMMEKLTSSVQVCERQGAKLSSLIDELLDLTRVRLGKLELTRERTDLSHLMQEVLDRFRPQAQKSGYEISLEGPTELWGVWDPARIDQVVTNLISNAIKYGDGNPISVILEQCGDESGKARSGKSVRIIVRDEGLGIAPNLQKKIFERFERAVTGEKISGLGLGLYITRQIVEAHGGTIGVSSILGRGSTFSVELPLELEARPLKKPNVEQSHG